jgi:probable HAF family extracellular repeat protein
MVNGRKTGDNALHPFSWTQAGEMIDPGTLGSNYSVVVAMNDSGQVVGDTGTGDNAVHPFSWTQAGGMIDLGTLGGTFGASTPAGDVATHAVLWQPIANLRCHETLAGCNLKGPNLAGAYLKDGDLETASDVGALARLLGV